MKKNTTTFFIPVILLLLLGIAAGFVMSGGKNPDISSYSAVYLSTGDVYFGHLTWFPHPRLTNVWLLQRGVNAQNQPQFGVVPFKNALWAPVDSIDLNSRDIVFWTSLRADSAMAKAMENPASVQAQPQPPEGNFPATPQNATGTKP
jgi:hypothetical protein